MGTICVPTKKHPRGRKRKASAFEAMLEMDESDWNMQEFSTGCNPINTKPVVLKVVPVQNENSKKTDHVRRPPIPTGARVIVTHSSTSDTEDEPVSVVDEIEATPNVAKYEDNTAYLFGLADDAYATIWEQDIVDAGVEFDWVHSSASQAQKLDEMHWYSLEQEAEKAMPLDIQQFLVF
jgi:hypothetical protein